MPLFRKSAFSQVTSLAARRPVHAAFAWLHKNPKTIMDWQAAVVAIPAPPFGEQTRAAWLAERFQEAGLAGVEIDPAGNVLGVLPAAHLPPESTGPVLLLSAHLDTVFPAGTRIEPVIDGDRLTAPGATDNAAGVAGMLAILYALVHSQVELSAPIVFAGNVGEEGEGDLRGVRQIYGSIYGPSRFSQRIGAHIVLDGVGNHTAVTQALGSTRFQVSVTGPGGHSFIDAATPNPITALAIALAALADVPLPAEPLTTMNVGTIEGGTSVNSIPESAKASVDFRSTDPEQFLRLEVRLHHAVESAVTRLNNSAAKHGSSSKSSAVNHRGPLSFTITKIGDRPAASLPEDSPLMATLGAVDRHLGLRTGIRLGSTDANLPLSLGVPALAIGAGGEGGATHTLGEWYSARDREIGLRRALLVALATLEWVADQ